MKESIEPKLFRTMANTMFGGWDQVKDKPATLREYLVALGIEDFTQHAPGINAFKAICNVLGWHQAMIIVEKERFQVGDRAQYYNQTGTITYIAPCGSQKCYTGRPIGFRTDGERIAKGLSGGKGITALTKIRVPAA